jgi:hypothetical protein
MGAAVRPGPFQDGERERMARAGIEGGSQGQHGLLAPAERDDVRDLWPALGQCSGLVEGPPP